MSRSVRAVLLAWVWSGCGAPPAPVAPSDRPVCEVHLATGDVVVVWRLDGAGRVREIVGPAEREAYRYDDRGRLRHVIIDDVRAGFHPSRRGMLISYEYEGPRRVAGRLVEHERRSLGIGRGYEQTPEVIYEERETYHHDAAGRLVGATRVRIEGEHEQREEVRFDADDLAGVTLVQEGERIIEARGVGGEPQAIDRFAYDQLGRPVEKTHERAAGRTVTRYEYRGRCPPRAIEALLPRPGDYAPRRHVPLHR